MTDLLASFNFCGFSISKLLSFHIKATYKGQNMLPIVGSIFFTLIIAPSSTFKHSTLQNVLFIF